MSYKLNLLILFLFFASLLEGQPTYSSFPTQDTINLRALMTYSESELDEKVNQIYSSINLKDSLSIQELYQNLEFEKIYEQINLDSIIKTIDWNPVFRAMNWNSILNNFDFGVMFQRVCNNQDSILKDYAVTDMSDLTTIPNMADVMQCMGGNGQPFDMTKPFDMMKLFNPDSTGLDMNCLMQKMMSGKISIPFFPMKETRNKPVNMLEMTCEMMECVNMKKMFGDINMDCLIKTIDINPIIKQYDFKTLLKNYDTLKTKNQLPALNGTIQNHPLLSGLNIDSLYKQINNANQELKHMHDNK